MVKNTEDAEDLFRSLNNDNLPVPVISLFRERKRSSASSVFFDHAFFTEYLNYRHRSSYTQFFVEGAALSVKSFVIFSTAGIEPATIQLMFSRLQSYALPTELSREIVYCPLNKKLSIGTTMSVV